MTNPVGFDPFKGIGGDIRIGEMTINDVQMPLPEIPINDNEPPVSFDTSQDEEGLVDILKDEFKL